MPKRIFNGDKAWRSNKLKRLPENLAAEYAWVYSVALADGTFEASPERIFSDAYVYNRPNWTVKKVAKMLNEFEKVGLLVRKSDKDGIVWGYWTGSDTELPSESDSKKYRKGKRYIFETPEPLRSDSAETPDHIEHGLVRFGIGLDRLGLGGEKSPTPERQIGEYRQGEFSYANHHPERLYAILVEKWREAAGPGAICRKPFKGGWKWFQETCESTEADALVPAFELWAIECADVQNEHPISDFLRRVGEYTARLVPAKPENTSDRQTSIDLSIEEAKARNNACLSRSEAPESLADVLERVSGQ